MSIQSLIDIASEIEIERREPVAGTLSRSGKYKTADRNINIFKFTVTPSLGLKYSENQELLVDCQQLDVFTTSNVSLNNNAGMNYLTASMNGQTNNAISIIGFQGRDLYVDTTGCTGSGNILEAGDYIQPLGNTNTYAYTYTVRQSVPFSSSGSNVTIQCHRPIFEQDGVNIVGSGLRLANDVRFNVKLSSPVRYRVVPGDNLQIDPIELVEVIT
tara:strand:- start:1360 stop:2004 length:645 start_codon:yes stop_codon:yes gene_type:complete